MSGELFQFASRMLEREFESSSVLCQLLSSILFVDDLERPDLLYDSVDRTAVRAGADFSACDVDLLCECRALHVLQVRSSKGSEHAPTGFLVQQHARAGLTFVVIAWPLPICP